MGYTLGMTQTGTTTQATTTYQVEIVSSHGRMTEQGMRYQRKARVFATTTDEDALPALRAQAKAQLSYGSSKWVEVNTTA